MANIPCAYCGKLVPNPDREHVFPRCLYPSSKAGSKVQRLTVTACRECNGGWADDEPHFRNMLVLSSELSAASRELWDTTISSSFDEVDGPKRVCDLIARMKSVGHMEGERYKVFLGEDERVMRIARKAIRGLCHHHGLISPVPEKRVWADVLRYPVPEGFLGQMSSDHREADIVTWRYQVLNEDGIHSVWLITFFERITFFGLVSSSADGFA